MNKVKELVVLGSVNIDHILNVQDFPKPGQTVHGDQYQVAYGGKGANQAVAAGRSGANISFIACIGEDDIACRVKEQFIVDHINVDAVQQIPGESTGVALIFVNKSAENVIAINSGANKALTPEFVTQHKSKIINASILLMQLESPLESVLLAAKIAKENQTKVILNPAPACFLPDELLSLIDVITPNETEAEVLTGVRIDNTEDAAKACEILHNKGIQTVLITMGSRGVWLSHNQQGQLIPAFVVHAIDTIGAGDTFNGAFMTALLEDKDIVDAIKFGNAAAAISVTRKGAQPSVPWRQEIDEFIQQH